MHNRQHLFPVIYIVLAMMLTACIETNDTLKVGEQAPSLRTKTLVDVGGDFSRITTYRYPDERMYQYSLDEAMKTDKLIILEFATPGHCTVCDKQLQMLKHIINAYESEILVLHMDQYENPGAFKAFRVKGDPWTFLIDNKGVVRFKRPGRLLYGELDEALGKILGDRTG